MINKCVKGIFPFGGNKNYEWFQRFNRTRYFESKKYKIALAKSQLQVDILEFNFILPNKFKKRNKSWFDHTNIEQN